MTRRLPLDAAWGLAQCLDRNFPILEDGMQALWSMCYGDRP